jgi:hypothetical protein
LQRINTIVCQIAFNQQDFENNLDPVSRSALRIIGEAMALEDLSLVRLGSIAQCK